MTVVVLFLFCFLHVDFSVCVRPFYSKHVVSWGFCFFCFVLFMLLIDLFQFIFLVVLSIFIVLVSFFFSFFISLGLFVWSG